MASYLETSMAIAREAGAILNRLQERKVKVEYKGDFDVVTEADRASEALIYERLRSHFPAHSIVAEEGDNHEGAGEFRWYVDPLDGTTNFAHGYLAYNVTMALEQSGELIAGVIYDPVRDEMYAAERGGGAYLNGRRIQVSAVAKVEESLVATGFPSRRRHLNYNIHFYHQMAMATHGVRRAGSAALDLAHVACGRLDAFWEFGLHPWDMAAGILMVREAGGTCTEMRGGEHSLTSPHLLADNSRIHEEILTQFGEIFRGEYRFPLPVIPNEP